MVQRDGRVDLATEEVESCLRSVTMINMTKTSGAIPLTLDASSALLTRVWAITRSTVAAKRENSTAVHSGKMEGVWQGWSSVSSFSWESSSSPATVVSRDVKRVPDL